MSSLLEITCPLLCIPRAFTQDNRSNDNPHITSNTKSRPTTQSSEVESPVGQTPSDQAAQDTLGVVREADHNSISNEESGDTLYQQPSKASFSPVYEFIVHARQPSGEGEGEDEGEDEIELFATLTIQTTANTISQLALDKILALGLGETQTTESSSRDICSDVDGTESMGSAFEEVILLFKFMEIDRVYLVKCRVVDCTKVLDHYDIVLGLPFMSEHWEEELLFGMIRKYNRAKGTSATAGVVASQLDGTITENVSADPVQEELQF